MKLWTVILCSYIVAVKGWSLDHVDTKFPLVFAPKQNEPKQFFGYSLGVIAGGISKVLLVGAPNATSDQTRIKSGAVYACDLSTGGGQCDQWGIQEQGNNVTRSPGLGILISDSMRENSCLGLSMATRGAEGVVCAPKWFNNITQPDSIPRMTPSGKCITVQVKNGRLQVNKFLFPLSKYDKQYGDKKTRLHAYSQGGMSAAFTKDAALVLGAPGEREWRGTVVSYKSKDRYAIGSETASSSSQFSPSTLFGYSVAPRNPGEIIVGAPTWRSDVPYGAVFLVTEQSFQDTRLKPIRLRSGSPFEYFSAAILSVDLNGDMSDELIVGSPFYTSSEPKDRGDQGKIQILRFDLNNFKAIFVKDIFGKHPGGRFGSSLISLGDINNDRFNDVAVGAPFEDDQRGAVYIYFGSINFLIEQQSQRIVAEERFKGFGVSFAVTDVDSNGYNDLVVGSFLSDHVAIFRTKPVADISIDFANTPRIIDRKSTMNGITGYYVPVSYCIAIRGSRLRSDMDFDIEIEMDPKSGTTSFSTRGYFLANPESSVYRRRVTVEKLPSGCFDAATIYIMDGTSLLRPLELSLKYTVNHDRYTDKGSSFCKDCPVTRGARSVNTTIPFATGCGSDNECVSQIKVTPTTIVNGRDASKIINGQDELIELSIEVDREDETAHNVKLHVVTRPYIPPRQLSVQCLSSVVDSEIVCLIANAFETKKKKLSLWFDVSQLGVDVTDITFGVNVTLANQLSPGSVTQAEKQVMVEKMATVQVSRTDVDTVLYDYASIRTEDEVKFAFDIAVEKFGPSPLKRIELLFKLPALTKELRALFEPKVTTRSEELEVHCNEALLPKMSQLAIGRETSADITSSQNLESVRVKREVTGLNGTFADKFKEVSCKDMTCIEIVCVIGPFVKQSRATIKFSSAINVTLFEQGKVELADMANYGFSLPVTVSTRILDRIENGGNSKSQAEVKVFFKQNPYSEQPSLFVHVASWSLGFFLFVLLILVLIKVGFFNRGKKAELERLINERNGSGNEPPPADPYQ
ncbi:Integrin alpha-8 [Halotydeus destructor]|nr:Integrin alpha-8 [Halotydeus destructor]